MNRFLLVLPKNSSSVKLRGKKGLPSSSSGDASERGAVAVSTPSSSSIIINGTPSDRNGVNSTTGTKQRKLVQHFLDIGQKNFGVPITCQLCQLLYVADDEEDVRRHRKYCEQKNRPPIVSFKTLLDRNKPLYVSDQDIDEVARIINVPETAVKVMHELRTRVFPQVQDDLQTSSTFFEKEGDRCWHNYIAVRNNGEVIGLLILEDVPHQSVRFISDIQELSIVDSDHIKRRRVDPSSSVENGPSWVGVHAIWVHRSYRRQGWAARLLDSGRAAYCFGQVIDKRQLAFSQPTTAGWALASRYLSPGSPCNMESQHLGTDSAKSIDGDSQENRSPILEIPCYV